MEKDKVNIKGYEIFRDQVKCHEFLVLCYGEEIDRVFYYYDISCDEVKQDILNNPERYGYTGYGIEIIKLS